MHQTVISYVCLEGQWYETVFAPVGLVVSSVEGVAILPTLACRAGEMIPEVERTRPWGPSKKRVPKCIMGPKTTYTTIAVAEKTVQEK